MRYYFYMFLVVTVWASIFPILKSATSLTSPEGFVFLRTLISFSLCIIPASYFYTKKKVKINKTIILSSFFSISTLGLLAKGSISIPSSLASFIFSNSIFFVIFINSILNKKLPTKIQIFASIVCVTGSLFMINNFDFTGSSASGIVYTLLGTLSNSFSVILIKNISSKDCNPLYVTFLQNSIVIIFSIFFIEKGIETITLISSKIFYAALYCSVFGSILSVMLQFHAQKRISTESTMIIVMFKPILGALLSYLFLGENIFSFKFILGGILIFSSLAMNIIESSNKEKI